MFRSEIEPTRPPEEQLLWDIFSNKNESEKMEKKLGRRKSFDVEYVEVTIDNIEEVAQWSKGTVEEHEGTRYIKLADKNAMNSRQNRAFDGDFVVRHLELNTFKSFGAKAFAKTYDTVVKVNKDSVTGQFVSDETAIADPEHTVAQTVAVPLFDADQSVIGEAEDLAEKAGISVAEAEADLAIKASKVAPDGVDPKSLGLTDTEIEADRNAAKNAALPRDAGLGEKA